MALYTTARQMKLLERASGLTGVFEQPYKVKMKEITNADTIGALTRQRKAAVTPFDANSAIAQSHSVHYAENSVVQNGNRIVPGSVKIVGGTNITVRHWLRMFQHNPVMQQRINAYNLSSNDLVRYRFDIEFDVER